MTRFKRLVTFLALFAGLAVGLSMSTVQPALGSGPTAPQPVSPPAKYDFSGGGHHVRRNGIYTDPVTGDNGQPVSKTVVSTGAGSDVIYVPNSAVVTYLQGLPGAWLNPQKITAVNYAESDGTSWTDYKPLPGATGYDSAEPTPEMTFSIPVSTTPGTYYFQLQLHYDHKGPLMLPSNDKPEDIYSEVFSVTVQPYPAASVEVNPSPQTVLWGQPADLWAVLNPSAANPPLTWTMASGAPGSLTNTNKPKTTFQSTVLSSATDSRLKTPSGTTTTATVTGENSAASSVTGSGTITVGGATPLTVERGESLRFVPDIILDTLPKNPVYKWIIYDDDYNVYTPEAAENTVLNTPTFVWDNVQADGALHMYYQLQVTDRDKPSSPAWYSNIAPITIGANTLTPTLVAVPNLAFAKSDGTDPSIAEFFNSAVTTLAYQTPANRPRSTYDGNNRGRLAVTSRYKGWRLSLALSGFKNTTTGNVLTGSAQAPAMGLTFDNGTSATTFADGTSSVEVASATASDPSPELDTKLSAGSLKVYQTNQVEAGTYEATATWTLVQAP